MALVSGCSSSTSDVADPVSAVFETGIASHYADSLAGRPTASGEPYDPQEKTCAHRTLALGTVVEVHTLRTGRTARCRVNDRGPYAKDRVLDVSRKVAEELGMEGGIAKVELRIVASEERDDEEI